MPEREKLRTLYQGWSTEELLDIHASGSPTDAAYAVLEDVLNERGAGIPQRPDKQSHATPPSPGSEHRARANASRCAKIFAIAGLVLPMLLLIATEQFGINVEIFFPFMFPASFLLFLFDWRGGFGPEVLFAVAFNMAVYAGFGWILGYGWSRR